MKRLLFFIWLMFPAMSFAGGAAWQAEIIEFERISATKAVFKLKNTEKIHTVFQACNPLTVIAEYKGEPW